MVLDGDRGGGQSLVGLKKVGKGKCESEVGKEGQAAKIDKR